AGQARVRLHVVAREHDAVLHRVAVEGARSLAEAPGPRDEERRGVRVAGARALEVLVEVEVERLREGASRGSPDETPPTDGVSIRAGAAGAQALLDLLPDLERDLRFRALPGPLAVVSLGVPRPDDHGEHAAVAVLPVHLVLPEARLGHARELPRRIRVIHVSVDPIDVFGEVVLN